jgi:predicted amidohydrolase
MKDVLRAALAVPKLKVADIAFNQEQIQGQMQSAAEEGAGLLLLPELALTGTTCGDLFLSDLLRERVAQALSELAVAVPEGLLTVLGAPLFVGGRLYNCAVVLGEGRILGAVPKTFWARKRVALPRVPISPQRLPAWAALPSLWAQSCSSAQRTAQRSALSLAMTLQHRFRPRPWQPWQGLRSC